MTEELQNYYDSNPWARVDANDGLILRKAAALNLTIEQAVSTLGFQINGGSLLVHPVYKQAWDSFTTKHTEFKGSGTAGNFLVAMNALNDHETPTMEALEEISERGVLAESNAYTQEHDEQRHRKYMIEDISQGRSTYSARDQYGVLKVYKTSDLESEDTPTLKKIHEIVQAQRSLQSMPPQQRREAIKQITKDNQPPTAVKIKNPLPAKYTCTVPSQHGYTVGQEVVLDTPVSFAKLGKEDQKILWIRHGSDALDALLRPGKA